jgi:hypothetical protein
VRGWAIRSEALPSVAYMHSPAHGQSDGGMGKRPCGEGVGPHARRTQCPVDDARRRPNLTITSLSTCAAAGRLQSRPCEPIVAV